MGAPRAGSLRGSTGAQRLAPEWDVDLVVVDEALARRALRRRFPQLELRSLRLLAAGWDNTVWVVDERWAFRFPRRAIALPGVERELAALPRLAPLLPVAVPVPTFVGEPGDDFPWPFFGAPLIRGSETCDAGLDDAARRRLARPLALFLRTLHDATTRSALADIALPSDPNRRADPARRVPLAREQLARVRAAGLWEAPAAADELLDAVAALPAAEPTAALHGDLHFRHVLVDGDGSLAGVIDWGDVCVGDPSIDLQLVWSFLPPAARDDFVDAYGDVSEDQALRARALAFSLCAAIALHAHDQSLPNVVREALDGLARAAAD